MVPLAPPNRVFVAASPLLLVTSMRLILDQETDLTVVGSACNGTSTLRQCLHLQPSLLVLDLQLLGKAPLEIIKTLQVHSPHTKTLVVSAFQNPTSVRALYDAGMNGYILKAESSELFLTAVRTVLRQATWLSQSVLDGLVNFPTPTAGQLLWRTLTGIERAIVLGIGQGLSNKQIAQEVCLAEQTVRNYSSQVYGKLGIPSRSSVIRWLYTHQIINLNHAGASADAKAQGNHP